MTRLESLRHPSVNERVRALQELVAQPSDATAEEIAAAIDALGDERKAVQRRAAEALAVCARTAPTLIDQLRTIATAGGWNQRWGSVFALSLLETVPPIVLPTLLEAFGRDDGDVRWAAADLLKRLAAHEPAVVTAALLHAARDGSAKQRKMALYCLRDLGVPDAASVAVAALADEVVDVRLAALTALVSLARDKEGAVGPVQQLMNDVDMGVRRAAAFALGQLGVPTPEVRAILQRAMTEDDPSLRRAAERALRLLAAC